MNIKVTSGAQVKQHLLQGWEFADANDWTRAIDCVDAAIQINPTVAVCWVTKGQFLRESKSFEAAESALKKAIEIDPAAYCAWTELGILFRDMDLYEQSAECLRESVSLHPDFNTYTILANVELTFDPEAALSDATLALELNPDWDEAIHVRDEAKKLVSSSESDGVT